MARDRGATNRNVRGNSRDRERRRQWLLDAFGDGVTARCTIGGPRCLGRVDIATITVDRIVPGCQGGTYRRGNIAPACGPCNYGEGFALSSRSNRGKLPDTALTGT